MIEPISKSALLPLRASLRGGPSSGLERQEAFARALNTAERRIDSSESPEAKSRDAAERFVSATFIQPLLKQFRESNQAAPPFAPSEAEKSFGGILDAMLADQIVQAQGLPIVERLARDLLRDSASAPQPAAGAPLGRIA
ncbi:MAG: hypothetical protein AAGK04_09605 [Planctomycetota bacterium]